MSRGGTAVTLWHEPRFHRKSNADAKMRDLLQPALSASGLLVWAAEVIDVAPKVVQMRPATGQRDEALEYAVMAVLHAAVTLRESETGPGIELECKICGQRDDQHTRSCLIPALEAWLNPV